MIKRWMQVNGVFLAVVTAIVMGSCHIDTEQDKVKKVVLKVQQAAENKDLKQVLSHLSKTYKDPREIIITTLKTCCSTTFSDTRRCRSS